MHRTVLDSRGVFASLEFGRNLIGMAGQAYQVEVLRVDQKRAVIGHDGTMLLVGNAITALLKPNSKTKFNKDAAIHLYRVIVSKCCLCGSEDGWKQTTKCASRRSPALNQIGLNSDPGSGTTATDRMCACGLSSWALFRGLPRHRSIGGQCVPEARR